MISSGELGPGSRLVEDRLAERLGVSRNPVREAIRLLEATGLVVVQPRRGAYVSTPDVDDLLALLEVRVQLEGYAAELAAARASTEDLDELDAVIASGRSATEAGDLVEASEHHRRFHEVVERVAGNRHVSSAVEPLRLRTEMIFSLLHDDMGQLSWAEHQAIADAIRSGDEAAARACMARHLRRVGRSLSERDDIASVGV